MFRSVAVLALLLCLSLPPHPLEGASEDVQVAALREMTRTVNAGDAAGYARLYADDAVITIFGSGTLRGRKAIEEHERDLLQQFPGTRLAFYAVWQDGPHAVVHYGVNGRTPAGEPMGHEGLLFYRFDPHGLIEEERRYLDSVTPMAQLGLLVAPARPVPTLADEMAVHTAAGSTGGAGDVALVKAALDALDAREWRGFLSRTSDDIVVDDLIFPAPFAGKQQVQSWCETWARTTRSARTNIDSIRSVGPFVLLETIIVGTLGGELAGVAAAARPFTVHRGLIVRIANGSISRLTAFMNRKELADAVGYTLMPGK